MTVKNLGGGTKKRITAATVWILLCVAVCMCLCFAGLTHKASAAETLKEYEVDSVKNYSPGSNATGLYLQLISLSDSVCDTGYNTEDNKVWHSADSYTNALANQITVNGQNMLSAGGKIQAIDALDVFYLSEYTLEEGQSIVIPAGTVFESDKVKITFAHTFTATWNGSSYVFTRSAVKKEHEVDGITVSAYNSGTNQLYIKFLDDESNELNFGYPAYKWSSADSACNAFAAKILCNGTPLSQTNGASWQPADNNQWMMGITLSVGDTIEIPRGTVFANETAELTFARSFTITRTGSGCVVRRGALTFEEYEVDGVRNYSPGSNATQLYLQMTSRSDDVCDTGYHYEGNNAWFNIDYYTRQLATQVKIKTAASDTESTLSEVGGSIQAINAYDVFYFSGYTLQAGDSVIIPADTVFESDNVKITFTRTFTATWNGTSYEIKKSVLDEGGLIDLYGDRTGQTLEVTALDKGLGVDWLRDAARNFNAGTGAKITVKADETLNDSLEAFVGAQSGSDVYFSFSAQNQWVRWARQDKIYSLDDVGFVYNESMEKAGVLEGVRYTMPYNYAPTGLVYNAEYIAQIPSHGEFTQGTFPATWQGLMDMCESVNTKWNKTALGQKVVPMSWGGSVGDMNYVFKGLWAQIDPEGYEAYWHQTTEQVTGQSNKSLLVNDAAIQAMDCVAALLNPTKNMSGVYYPGNSFADSTGHSNLMAEQKFLNGLAVFTVSAAWFETEMREQIEESEVDFYHFTTLPIVNEGSKETLHINSPAEYFMVTKNGKNNNPDLAKAFLRYMATEERCKVFQAYTGVPAALKYKMQTDSLSRFAKEVAEAMERSYQAVSVSDRKALLSGAIAINFTEPYIRLATNEHTDRIARTIIEDLYTKQYTDWNDYIKTFD